jgi:hypothetical protein
MNEPLLRRRTRRRLPPQRAPEMCAEYSGRLPNCNAAPRGQKAPDFNGFGNGRLASVNPDG